MKKANKAGWLKLRAYGTGIGTCQGRRPGPGEPQRRLGSAIAEMSVHMTHDWPKPSNL